MRGSVERFCSKHPWPLVCAGAFAWLWIVARACVQSITIDEADTYLEFVAPRYPFHWAAAANNHVLNSALMRLSTSLLGASALTLRLPALLGAALYIAAVYFLVRLISGPLVLQWALYVCLIFSPLVMDYLVAARGYSLALAFLALAVTVAARHQALGPEARSAALYRTAALVSAILALSFCASFPFAIADAATALLLSVWMSRGMPARYMKLLAAAVLPGLAAAYLITGPTLLAWPKGQLAWGAASLWKTGGSVLTASLFEPNSHLLNPHLFWLFLKAGRYLFPLLGVLFLWRTVTLILNRAAVRQGASRWRAGLAAACGGILIVTLACHWLLYAAFGILLPQERTALFIAPLCLIMAGAATAIPLSSRMGRASGVAVTAVLTAVACYSLGCLRLTYFKEWRWDADVKNVYSVLAYYNHAYGVTAVSAEWRYASALNCYRALSGRETIHEIAPGPAAVEKYPPGFPLYVLHFPEDEPLLAREKLKVVYRDAFTNATVAIRPELESARLCSTPH